MVSIRRLVLTAGAALAGASSLVACGSVGSVETGSSGSGLRPALGGTRQDLSHGKRGGELTVYDKGDFQSLDPGQSYSALDYGVVDVTQRRLYGYSPNDSEHLVPDLASGPPIISSGGRTVTVHIRRGVHFSPPVAREVTSADVAYAIERGANPHVANAYFSTYFSVIAGADKADGGAIPGISTPGKYTIVFHLARPEASYFVGALSMPLTAPVPKEYAAPLDSKQPTTYGSVYEVATGPYMLRADAGGKILGIGYQPGESATLVRNPNWASRTDPRPAYLDGIKVKIGGDATVIGRQVLMGSHAVQGDTPAAPIVELAYKKYRDQLITSAGAGVSFVSLNNARGPFSSVNTRKALWAALDRAALINAMGGRLIAQLGTHFIYPGTSGYDLAGGDRGPNVNYNQYPRGNAALAARYMRLAGYATGKYNGTHIVTIVGANQAPGDNVATIVNGAVQSLGFKTRFVLVDPSVMMQKFCAVPTREIDVCPNVGWIRDWSDPQTILDPLFSGYNIYPTGTANTGQVSWQDAHGTHRPGQPLTSLDQAIKTAEATSGQAARARAWAKVDHMLVADAAAIPWLFGKQPTIESADVRGVIDTWNQGEWDFAYTSLT